jgi:hypothetical protein
LEPLLVGVLTALTAVLGVAYWQLLVRPESMLQLWSDPDSHRDEWFEHHPGAVRALRYAAGGMVFVFGFLTGLTLTFLLGT